MLLRKKPFGCQCSHSWTFCTTSSLLRNLFPPRCPFRGTKIVWGSKVRTVWRMWYKVPFQFLDCVHGASSHVWTDVILEKWHWCLRPFSPVPDGWCRVIFSVYCATLCEEIHVQYTFRVPEDGGHKPSQQRTWFSLFLGFGDPGWSHYIEERLLSSVK